MKTMIALVTLLTVGQLATPPKANAGIVLCVFGNYGWGTVSLILGVGGLGAAIGIGAVNGDFVGSPPDISIPEAVLMAIGSALIVLGKDGPTPQSVSSAFPIVYNWIEDAKVIKGFSLKIVEKANAVPYVEEKKTIYFSDEEIDVLLSPIDWSGHENQIEQLKLDLST